VHLKKRLQALRKRVRGEDELHRLIKVLKNLRNVLDTRVLLMMQEKLSLPDGH